VRRGLSFLVFLFICVSLQAQYSLLDTFRTYLKKEPTFYISFDGRKSFVRDQPAQIDGLRFGLSFGGKVRLLAGFYRLHNTITREYIYAQGTPDEELRHQSNRLVYMGLTCDYVLYNRGRWKLALPVMMGYGFGDRVERNSFGQVRLAKESRFVPFECALNANFRVLPWFYLGGGIGYRYALFSNSVSKDFSAPIYTYGLGIDLEWFWDRYLRDFIDHKGIK